MHKHFLFLMAILALTVVVSCKTHNTEDSTTNQAEVVAKDFFKTFADRNDWEKMCSFYREDMQFEDILLQLKLDSLWQFKRFYKWDEEGGNFRKLTPDQEHLSIYSLVVNDSIAVARGRINPFYYYNELIDEEWGMEFTIWLYFDENLKIKKQVDWMEYAPGVFETVIKRVQEHGIEKTPDWLDLSR